MSYDDDSKAALDVALEKLMRQLHNMRMKEDEVIILEDKRIVFICNDIRLSIESDKESKLCFHLFYDTDIDEEGDEISFIGWRDVNKNKFFLIINFRKENSI